MTFWKWSTNAGSNATADSTCPFPEGMAPSAVNDGTRGMMAAAAKYRDDTAGILLTTGSLTAYNIISNQGFDTLAHLHGAMICFTPHTTNGANGTSLNVDGLGGKPILLAPGVGLQAGVLIQGTPYAVTYNDTDSAFYLHGAFGNPYNIPLAGGLDYWGPTAPNSSFAFPAGQPISRATYSALFAIIGTIYGGGDGSTTFNLPDKRGRVSAALDAGIGRLTDAVSGFGDALGEAGGLQTHTLLATQIPPLTSSGANNFSASSVQTGVPSGADQGNYFTHGPNNGVWGAGRNGASGPMSVGQITVNGSVSITSTTTGTNGLPHNNVQPTICCNYIIRIL